MKKLLSFILGTVLLVGGVLAVLYFTGVFDPTSVIKPSLADYDVFVGQSFSSEEKLTAAYNNTKNYDEDFTFTSEENINDEKIFTTIKIDGDITYLEEKTVVGEVESVKVYYFEKTATGYYEYAKQADKNYIRSEISVNEYEEYIENLRVYEYFRVDNNDGKSGLNEYNDRKSREDDSTKFDKIAIKFYQDKISLVKYSFIETLLVDGKYKEVATKTISAYYEYVNNTLTLPEIA